MGSATKPAKTTFETGPVDPMLPLELDDGTPVELKRYDAHSVTVIIPEGATSTRNGQHHRDGFLIDGPILYSLADGVYAGGNPEEFHVLRNVRPPETRSSLPEDDATRGDFPMFDGLLAYFPNALAYVSQISRIGNEQHNPGEPMHWARDKSTDHANKVIRHLVDAGKVDARGVRHTGRAAWRILALLQEEIEREEGLPPSRASRNAHLSPNL